MIDELKETKEEEEKEDNDKRVHIGKQEEREWRRESRRKTWCDNDWKRWLMNYKMKKEEEKEDDKRIGRMKKRE